MNLDEFKAYIESQRKNSANDGIAKIVSATKSEDKNV